MNTPRLLLFGLFLPPHTYLPSREQNVHPEVFFFECWASLGNHGYIIPVSKPRSFFALLTDVVIGLLLNVTYYMPFLLPDAPHRTDYSQSEGDQKHFFFFTIINLFPKRLSRNQSINHFIYVNTWWDGVAPIIRAEGSCMEHMTKHMMDFLYFSFPLTNNFSNHLY